MREKLLLTPLVLLLSTSIFAAKEATILKVSKTMNSKNVLHYKVNYDEETCELTSDVFAQWKMDEEDGRWKPLEESMGMIKGPLLPKILSKSVYEVEFVTDSMKEFQDKKILSNDLVRVNIESADNGCKLSNEVDVKGRTLSVEQLHTKVTMFGNVKWVQIIGRDSDGKKVNLGFDDKGRQIQPNNDFIKVD